MLQRFRREPGYLSSGLAAGPAIDPAKPYHLVHWALMDTLHGQAGWATSPDGRRYHRQRAACSC